MCPLIKYYFYVEHFNCFIKTITYSFDIKSLNKESYSDIYEMIFKECLSMMNSKNQELIRRFFDNINNDDIYHDFINIYLVEYINNLSKKQQVDLGKTGLVNAFFTYDEVEDYKLSSDTLTMITIDIRDDGKIKIKYPKMTTIAPIIPLIIITNFYKYYSDVINSLKDNI